MTTDTLKLAAAENKIDSQAIEIGQLAFEVGCLKADIERLNLQLECERMTITAAIEMLSKRVVIE